MTLDELINDKYVGYDGYEELIFDGWNLATERSALIVDKMAVDAEKEREPSSVVDYYKRIAEEIRAGKREVVCK